MNNNYCYDYIQERKKTESINVVIYSRAIVEELRNNKFEQAEELLREMHDHRYTIREDSPHYLTRLHGYQRAICSIVRYASSPAKAQEYAEFFFRDVEKPLRTPGTEMIVFTNLVYVYAAEGSPASMRKALEVINLVIEIGAFEIDPLHYDMTRPGNNFTSPLEVFLTVSQKVLRYHSLVLSADKKSLLPK